MQHTWFVPGREELAERREAERPSQHAHRTSHGQQDVQRPRPSGQQQDHLGCSTRARRSVEGR
jgi:hypothetical protein